jgi:hypothetical protein
MTTQRITKAGSGCSQATRRLMSPLWRVTTMANPMQILGSAPCRKRSRLGVKCPLWVISRHFAVQTACLLYPRKLTLAPIINVC